MGWDLMLRNLDVISKVMISQGMALSKEYSILEKAFWHCIG